MRSSTTPRCTTRSASIREATLSTVSQAAQETMVARAAIPIQGQPTDLTSALLFLVDEQSRWVTGQTIIVDGGLTTRL